MKKALLLLSALLAGSALAEEADDRVTYTSHVTYGSYGYANITTEHGTHDIKVTTPKFTCVDATETSKEIDYIGETHTMGVDVGSQ